MTIINVEKKVVFNEKIVVYTTYAPDEYDRSPIDSIIYKKSFGRISDKEWVSVWSSLVRFKTTDMRVHKSSLQNTILFYG